MPTVTVSPRACASSRISPTPSVDQVRSELPPAAASCSSEPVPPTPSYPGSQGMAEDERERRESGRAPMELPVEYDRLNALLSDYI